MSYNRKSLKITVRPEDASPALQLISTADMKTFLKVTSSSDDSLIAELVQAATEGASEFMRRSILTTTYVFNMDSFSDYRVDEIDRLGAGVFTAHKATVLGYADNFDIPMPPIQSVTSIVTYGTDNSSSTFSASYYQLDEQGGRIYLNQGQVWPTNLRDYEAVAVTYIAGYGDTAADVPRPITQAVKMWVGKMYEHRGYCEMPATCEKLLMPYKRYDNLGYC